MSVVEAPTVRSDSEVIAVLDFDPEIGCEGVLWEPNCASKADWFVVCRFCHVIVLTVCEGHVQAVRAHTALFGWVGCDDCGEKRPTWDDIADLIPVRGRS